MSVCDNLNLVSYFFPHFRVVIFVPLKLMLIRSILWVNIFFVAWCVLFHWYVNWLIQINAKFYLFQVHQLNTTDQTFMRVWVICVFVLVLVRRYIGIIGGNVIPHGFNFYVTFIQWRWSSVWRKFQAKTIHCFLNLKYTTQQNSRKSPPTGTYLRRSGKRYIHSDPWFSVWFWLDIITKYYSKSNHIPFYDDFSISLWSVHFYSEWIFALTCRPLHPLTNVPLSLHAF